MGKHNYGGSAYLALTGRLGSAALAQLFSSESRMARRTRKGKNQSGDSFDNVNLPDYLQTMLGVGRDSNGNISSKAASRGAGFTDKEVATEYANWAKTQEERAYENQLWNERESIQGQVNQMKNAGLNPALMYGSGVSGSGGSPVSSTPTESGSSSYDEFGGAFGTLTNILQLLGLGQNVASGISTMKSQSTERRNQTAQTDAAVSKSNAERDLVVAQTEAQNNLNSTFWQSWSADIANKRVDTLLKSSQVKVNLEEAKAIAKRLEQDGQKIEILKYQASSERMQVIANINKINAEIANLSADTLKKGVERDTLLEKLKQVRNDSVISDIAKTEEQLREFYGVPKEWAFYVDAVYSKFAHDIEGMNAFSKWLSGFQQSLANKETAFNYVTGTTQTIFGMKFGTESTKTGNFDGFNPSAPFFQ